MKAVVFRPEKGLSFEDAPDPQPDADQVLVRVSDTGFCGSDHSLVESGNLPDGYILGHETSGEVVEIGARVKGLDLGTRVVIRPTYCGQCPDCLAGRPYFCQVGRRSIGIGDLPGAFAEYILVYPQMLIPVPPGVDSQNAALAEAFAAALHGINCAGIKGGSALVIGGGPIGLAAVRLLKIMGFGPVALSEPVASKREFALNYGADAAVDPVNENLGLFTFETTGGLGFGTVLECSGVPDCIQSGLDAAARGAAVSVVSVITRPAAIQPLSLNFKEVRLTGSYSNTHEENIQCLKWMAEGVLDARPLITDVIKLDELPETYRTRISTGRAIKVLIRIGPEF